MLNLRMSTQAAVDADTNPIISCFHFCYDVPRFIIQSLKKVQFDLSENIVSFVVEIPSA